MVLNFGVSDIISWGIELLSATKQSCPSKNLWVEESNENTSDYVCDDNDEVLQGDDSATLVIQKSLISPKGDLGWDWLQTSLFYSTYTIEDNVYNLIIDSDICEKMMSSEAIKKLRLKTEKHYRTYKLKWLKQDSKVIVDES